MAGRTHLQPAMPSSVGLWAAAHAEELLDDLTVADAAFHLADACPLGSAASYGVPLPLDREMVADLLGFARVQNNVLYANNSRGRVEAVVLSAVEQASLTLARMAQDLILYSMPEFGWFTLPKELCSGSSIMPQKRNPDGLELVRAKAAVVGADLDAVTVGHPGPAQRLQPRLPADQGTVLPGVRDRPRLRADHGPHRRRSCEVNADRLAAGFTPDVFATDAAWSW